MWALLVIKLQDQNFQPKKANSTWAEVVKRVVEDEVVVPTLLPHLLRRLRFGMLDWRSLIRSGCRSVKRNRRRLEQDPRKRMMERGRRRFSRAWNLPRM